VAWSASNEFLLVSVPLFVLLGEILLRAGFAERMYGSLIQWVSWLPGGLMHSNIATCGIFAATSGSSVATAATVGTVALPQARRFGYNERVFLGTLAAGGTLGILIPPSINMIIYAVLTNTSVPKLYLAGIVPGVLLMLLFMLIVVLLCVVRPAWGGQRVIATWPERFRGLVHLAPPAGIFFVVVGSNYVGIATPTEAALLASLVLAWWKGRLSRAMLRDAIEGTMKTTAMVMLIILAAYFLNFVMSGIGLTTALTAFIEGLGLPPAWMLLAVILFYVVLGCFMETLSMMITTIPIVAPVMFKLGYDPVWFGIIVILLIETALVTPPVGLNLFVVQNLRRTGTMNDVIIGTLPFVAALFAMLALLAFFPGLATWLPAAFG
jgi:tripartite ATP-independent transporter DctM subunit